MPEKQPKHELSKTNSNKPEEQKNGQKEAFFDWVKLNRDKLSNFKPEQIRSLWQQNRQSDEVDNSKNTISPEKNDMESWIKKVGSTILAGLAAFQAGVNAPLPNYIANFRDYVDQKGETKTEKNFTPEQIRSIQGVLENKIKVEQKLGQILRSENQKIPPNGDLERKQLYENYYQKVTSEEFKLAAYEDYNLSEVNQMFKDKSKNLASWLNLTPAQQVMVQLGRFTPKFIIDGQSANGQNFYAIINDRYDFGIDLGQGDPKHTTVNNLDDLKKVGKNTYGSLKEGKFLHAVGSLAPLVGKPFDFKLKINLSNQYRDIYLKNQETTKMVKNWLSEHQQTKEISTVELLNTPRNLYNQSLNELSGVAQMQGETSMIELLSLVPDLKAKLEGLGVKKEELVALESKQYFLKALINIKEKDKNQRIEKAATWIMQNKPKDILKSDLEQFNKVMEKVNSYKKDGLSDNQAWTKIFQQANYQRLISLGEDPKKALELVKEMEFFK